MRKIAKSFTCKICGFNKPQMFKMQHTCYGCSVKAL